MYDGDDDAPEQVATVNDVNYFVAETFDPEIDAAAVHACSAAGLAADVELTTEDFWAKTVHCSAWRVV